MNNYKNDTVYAEIFTVCIFHGQASDKGFSRLKF